MAGEGLRERKRRTAMDHIQRIDLDLFDAEGYEAVTIEQIAEASEVSPSSVYRYFGTKEGLVISDSDDEAVHAAIAGFTDLDTLIARCGPPASTSRPATTRGRGRGGGWVTTSANPACARPVIW